MFNDFGNLGIANSDGAVWRHNRRLALQTLREFGLGRNIMEEKVLRQTRWLLDQIGSGGVLDLANDMQLAIGALSSLCYWLFNGNAVLVVQAASSRTCL